MNEIRKKNLRLLINNKFNGSQSEFATHVGRQPDYVSRILSGKKNLGENLARTIEDACGLPKLWLDNDHASAPPALPPPDAGPGPALRGKVPLISWVQAGSWADAVDLLQPGEGYEWVDVTCPVKAHTYALRVVGDSMAPLFADGCIVVVEPELDCRPGDYVIAKNGDNEATFKQLVKDGADWYLKPLNDRYPIKPLGHSKIIGVVREMIQRFR